MVSVATWARELDEKAFEDDPRREHRRPFHVEVGFEEHRGESINPSGAEVGVLTTGQLDGEGKNSRRDAGVSEVDSTFPQAPRVIDLEQ